MIIKNDLANYLDVSPKEIHVACVIPVVWSDTSLGLPKPGEYYLQVLTPGYIIYLHHNKSLYRYHTNAREPFIIKRAREHRWWQPIKPILPPIEPPPIKSIPIDSIIPPPPDEWLKAK